MNYNDLPVRILVKRAELAWKSYADGFKRELDIDNDAPPNVIARWKALEPMLEHAFKYGYAEGGVAASEMRESLGKS